MALCRVLGLGNSLCITIATAAAPGSISYSISGEATSIMSTYRFLSDHYIGGVYFQAGTTATTADVPGGTIPAPTPSGLPYPPYPPPSAEWIPSGNVEPMDAAAVAAFYAAGPQMPGKVQQQWTGIGVPPPKTRWVAVGGQGQPGLYQLSGLGAGLAPLQWFGAAPSC